MEFKPISRIYTRVLPSDGTIRLLVISPAPSTTDPISCRLILHNLAHSPDYEALSYTWGTAPAENWINLNGQPFAVRPNLFAALCRLRRTNIERWVWVDAVCVNQDDVGERNQFVREMRRIYERASRVVIWLGEPPEDGSWAVASLDSAVCWTFSGSVKMWKQSRHNGKWSRTKHLTSLEGVREAFGLENTQEVGDYCELMDRPWWRRVWIVQEAAMAQQLVIMCGADEANWDRIQHFLDVRTFGEDEFEIFFGKKHYYPMANWKNIDRLRKLRQSGAFVGLCKLLYEFRSLHCTDPRDRIYAFLGLADETESLNIVPDYNSSTTDVYTDFARADIARRGKLDILTCCRVATQHRVKSDTSSVAYSLTQQSKYHDTEATIASEDGSGTRKGWARLPPGWERFVVQKRALFKNHHTGAIEASSPLTYLPPINKSTHAWDQREIPEGWEKTWDDIGRVCVRYNPSAPVPPAPFATGQEMNLPSWVPNWATPSATDPAPLLSFDYINPDFDACGRFPDPNVIPHPNPRVLSLAGLHFDTIDRLAPAWTVPWSPALPSRRGIPALVDWEFCALHPVPNCPYASNDGGRSDALRRTYIANMLDGEYPEPEAFDMMEIWRDVDGWATPLRSEATRNADALSAFKSLLTYGYNGAPARMNSALDTMKVARGETVSKAPGMRAMLKNPKLLFKAGPEAEYLALCERIKEVCFNRALFVTKRGYMGVAPWNALVGDSVVVMMGGQTPYLLRSGTPSSGDGMWTLVGDAYVHGIMDGEAVAAADADMRLEVFNLQ